MKLLVTAFMVVYGSIHLKAQTQVNGWLGTFNTVTLGKKTSLHLDVQARTTNKWQQWQTILMRPGLNFKLRTNITVSAGYALIHNRRILGNASGYFNEQRIWQQFMITQPLLGGNLAHRFRIEQRFIPKLVPGFAGGIFKSGYANAYRMRYFFRTLVPLKKEKKFSKGFFAAVQNEVFMNLGDKSAVNGQFFDQNRVYLAAGWRSDAKYDWEIGYMNQYVKGRNTSFSNSHIIQLAAYLRL